MPTTSRTCCVRRTTRRLDAVANMKILFSCGNAPGLPTGYGGQGLLALRSFLHAKCEVAVLAWNLGHPIFKPYTRYSTEEVLKMQPSMSRAFEARDAALVPWGSVSWYSNPYTQFPAPIQKHDINRMIADFDADLFVSLQDIFMFQPGSFLCCSAVWMPLHFLPVEHPTVLSLSDFDLQLPISGWGALLLEQLHGDKHGINGAKTLRHISVVPHGRNTEVFKPLGADFDREDFRARWGWPQDAFVVLCIASNSEESGRKAFDAQIQGFLKFAETEPRAWLHIHSEVARAYDIGRLLETFGLWGKRGSFLDWRDPRVRTAGDTPIRGSRVSVSHASQLLNLGEADLVKFYNAADVLLAATCSEGCGVPILEAQLAGCPVVTTRATAMWEETYFGVSVEPEQWIARMDFNSGWWLPHSKGIASALAEISGWSGEERAEKLLHGRAKVVAEFSDETVIKAWSKVLDMLRAEIESNYHASELRVHEARRVFLRFAGMTRKQYVKARELGASMDTRSGLVKDVVKLEGALAALQR